MWAIQSALRRLAAGATRPRRIVFAGGAALLASSALAAQSEHAEGAWRSVTAPWRALARSGGGGGDVDIGAAVEQAVSEAFGGRGGVSGGIDAPKKRPAASRSHARVPEEGMRVSVGVGGGEGGGGGAGRVFPCIHPHAAATCLKFNSLPILTTQTPSTLLTNSAGHCGVARFTHPRLLTPQPTRRPA
jgi:hypothetical protein